MSLRTTSRRLRGLCGLVLAAGIVASDAAAAPVQPGLVLWLDAGQNVTRDGSNRVSAWGDITDPIYNTVAQNVDQADTAKQPLWLASGIGGRPAMSFDGGDWLNNVVDSLVSPGSPRTVFVVGDAADASDGGVLLTFRQTALNFPAMVWNFGGTVYTYSDGVHIDSNASIPSAALNVVRQPFISMHRSTGGSSPPDPGQKIAVDINGWAQTVTQSYGVYTETGTTGFTVGSRQNYSPSSWLGSIAEILVYDRSLTPAEIAQVGSYLGPKYGIEYAPEPGGLVLLASAGGLCLLWAALRRRRERGRHA